MARVGLAPQKLSSPSTSPICPQQRRLPTVLDTFSRLHDDVGPPLVVGVIMDVVVWLRSLGLGKYEAVFRENEITEKVLPNLTAEDLKELGVAALAGC